MASEDASSAIKKGMADILEGNKPSFVSAPQLIFSANEHFSELTQDALLSLFVPFINSAYFVDIDIVKAKTYSKNFLDDIISLRALEDSPRLQNIAGCYRRAVDGRRDREDRLYLKRRLREVPEKYIEWEDRECVLRLIEYCAYRAIEIVSWAVAEEQIRDKADEATKPTLESYAYKLTGDGRVDEIRGYSAKERNMTERRTVNVSNPYRISDEKYKSERQDLLKRRIRPSMSLGDYAEILKEKMIMADRKKDGLEEVDTEDQEGGSSDSSSLSRAREDEVADRGNIFRHG